MTKYLFSLLMLGLIVGCGDSSGEKRIEKPSPLSIEDVNQSAEGTIEIDDSVRDKYLEEINRVRHISRDCGKVNDKNEAIDKDGNVIADRNASRYVYDGSNTQGGPSTNALNWNDKLYKAAYEHNYDMAHSHKISHTGSGTKYDHTGTIVGQASTYKNRIQANGYGWSEDDERFYYGNLAENLTVSGEKNATKTVEKAIELLLKSPGHCTNLMSNKSTDVGMAKYHHNDGEKYYSYFWTQEFGCSREETDCPDL